jgi:Pyruvate/2-oxoacid:ferredoxin oxidoreductase delta subunit
MSNDVYQKLLEVMKTRGGMFAGDDIPEFFALAEELFTPQEAEVNNAMPKGPFTAAQLAQQMLRDPKEIEAVLESMANKGLCMAMTVENTVFYSRAPFMPGIFEFQFMSGRITDRDKKIAKLIHAYKAAYNQSHPPAKAPGFPAIRVITVDKMIQPRDTVHTYDQVQHFIDQNNLIAISTCYCRHAAVLREEDIHGMPLDVCMQFGNAAQFAIERLGGRKVAREEARAILDRTEEAGLIHMSQNMADGIGFICNCDRWHCTPVTQALKSSKPALVMNSGFEPEFDPDACTACEACIDRCPPEALTMGANNVPEINIDRCFGCAVCATGCPVDAISMIAKQEFAPPPKDAKALKEALKASVMI